MTRNLFEMEPGERERWVNERHNLQVRETNDLLIEDIVGDYERRREEHWDRDHSSIDDYLESVAPNRERWRDVLGTFDEADDLRAERRPLGADGVVELDELTLRLFDDREYRARGVLGLPVEGDGPFPLVICLHGAGSSPEKVFGFDDARNNYHGYGYELVREGYAVLAPRFINAGGDRGGEARRKLEVFCQSIGRSLFGLEAHRIGRFIDYLAGEDAVDDSRIAAWGISMGGATTLFTLPVEQRIDVGICTAFFNDRLTKHVLDEPRYSHFRPVSDSVHFFLPGWFREFGDADLTSLICPRPFQVQTGIADDIDWRPYLEAEFDRAEAHYERLGVGDRIDLLEHEGGHEIHLDGGIEFLDAHL